MVFAPLGEWMDQPKRSRTIFALGRGLIVIGEPPAIAGIEDGLFGRTLRWIAVYRQAEGAGGLACISGYNGTSGWTNLKPMGRSGWKRAVFSENPETQGSLDIFGRTSQAGPTNPITFVSWNHE